MSESIVIEIAAVLDNAVFDGMTKEEKIGLVFSQVWDKFERRTRLNDFNYYSVLVDENGNTYGTINIKESI